MTETPDPILDPGQLAALETMLPLVSMHGWTRRALEQGLRDAGLEVSEAEWRFPGGAPEMIEVFFARALHQAVSASAPQVASEMRLTKRVRAVVAALFAELAPHKEAVRRAVSWLILPVHARLSAQIMARLVNGIWGAAGDQAADASRYTKRATLAAILLPTLLFWLSDIDFDNESTLAFFDRRLRGVGRIGRIRGQLQDACQGVMGPRARARGRAAA
jgi:ubiquinone biosynthesis protein COQ9